MTFVARMKAGLFTAAAAMTVLLASPVVGQDNTTVSCVQIVQGPSFSSCPCDEASFSFTMEGQTSVAANTVNLALVLDGSTSILSAEWPQEKDFAKDAVVAFADRNLFDNGGSASYVQFSSVVQSYGTFTSLEDYEDFVDEDFQVVGGTNIAAGIQTGQELLIASPSTASFMIVITDGEYNYGGDPTAYAEAARAEGTTIFAVGVGASISQATLLSIAGEADNVFDIANFDELDEALEGILATSGGAVISCPATDVSIAVEFSVPVASVSYPGATISDTNTVTFAVDSLESNPTEFTVTLDTCSATAGTSVVSLVEYTDEEGNLAGVSSLLTAASVENCPTPSPLEGATPSPVTPSPVGQSTPSPVQAPSASATAPPTSVPEGATPSPTVGTGGSTETQPPVTVDSDCAVCSNVSSAQLEALASYDNGGKRIVCDPTCVDGVSDPSHCNYFGLGQICRGCGDCSVCTPCPN